MSEDDIGKLSESLKKLRVEYERYFLGLERMEPLKPREAVKKELRRLLTETNIRNTARRFRLQTLQATVITYEAYWDRIARQIEEGTFKRDKAKARAILEADNLPEVPGDNDGETPSAAPQAASAATPRPAPRPAEANEDYSDSIKSLHKAYEQARQQAGDTRAVPIAALAATVRKQAAAIKAQYNCKTVEFKVTIKDGKPILKAVPKN